MIKKILKFVAAAMVFILIFSGVQDILVSAEDDRTPKRINGFYKNEKETLDAVFLGSSATYTFLIAPYVWREYGITVYPYASQAQPIQAARYLIEECRKTQPDAVYIINISAINGNVKPEWLHVLFDNMPFSLTKIKAIEYVCDSYDYDFEEKLEYVFPIIKYHDRWASCSERDFQSIDDEFMTGNHYWSFLKLSKNVGSIGVIDKELTYEIPDYINQAIIDLIEYIKEEDVKVQFVVTPQSIKNSQKVGILNSAVNLIEDNGYKVLDMRADHEKVGMDYRVDYYNAGHTNMHGAIKTSAYLAEHIINEFDLEDKRGSELYSVWDDASDLYYEDYLIPNLIESDYKYFKSDLNVD